MLHVATIIFELQQPNIVAMPSAAATSAEQQQLYSVPRFWICRHCPYYLSPFQLPLDLTWIRLPLEA